VNQYKSEYAIKCNCKAVQLPLIGMSEHSATIVIAGPAGPAWPLTPSGCQKSGT